MELGHRDEITVKALFRPQVWINDYAIEIDGKREFDVTLLYEEAVKILEARDHSYETDELWYSSPLSEEVGHYGPFDVEVCYNIEKALKTDLVDLEKESEEGMTFIECGCCGSYHRSTYYGDCRNDAERFDDIPPFATIVDA